MVNYADDDRTSSQPIYSVVYSVYIDGKQMDRTVVLPGSCFYVFDIEIPEDAKELKLVCEQDNSSTHKDYNMDSEWGLQPSPSSPKRLLPLCRAM